VKASDVVIILISVIFIGLVAAWYPIRYLTRRYVDEMKEE